MVYNENISSFTRLGPIEVKGTRQEGDGPQSERVIMEEIKFKAYDFKVQNYKGGDEFGVSMKVPVLDAPAIAILLVEAMRTGRIADVTIKFYDPNPKSYVPEQSGTLYGP